MDYDPSVWGRKYWFVLHTISLTYPNNPNDTAKRKYYDLIQNLPLFLPNRKIAKEFAAVLDLYPVKPYLDSRESFIKWMHFIHNEINKQNGKGRVTYQQFRDDLNKQLETQQAAEKALCSDKNVLTGFMLFCMLGIIILERYRRRV
tara:strand:- start:794 stop:1231 length:438 start_codon:yes stop_codon:yes gene_type:complete